MHERRSREDAGDPIHCQQTKRSTKCASQWFELVRNQLGNGGINEGMMEGRNGGMNVGRKEGRKGGRSGGRIIQAADKEEKLTET